MAQKEHDVCCNVHKRSTLPFSSAVLMLAHALLVSMCWIVAAKGKVRLGELIDRVPTDGYRKGPRRQKDRRDERWTVSRDLQHS
jgi:hypothetical protein